MLRFGEEPFLEVSSKGDKRFSAFYARIRFLQNKSIEELYQGIKIFDGGETGLNWREAKGRKATNQEQAHKYYSHYWDLYFQENPELLKVIMQYNGFSDIFGQEGHCCQAQEIWRIYQAEQMRIES